MKRIIYQTDDGGVAIIVPSTEYLANHTIEELAAKDVPEGKAYHIVDEANIPSDRTYRSAWEVVAGNVSINQTKVQAIQDEIAAKAAVRAQVLATLGITEEQATLLLGG